MINVENPDFPSVPTIHPFNLFDPPSHLPLPLFLCTGDLFERGSLEVDEGRTRFINCNVMCSEAGV